MEWLSELVAWAWARHHNILSWYIRPLFLLPFCFFAYRRSGLGIALTLVALATSMAWFPAPTSPSPAVIEMLNAALAGLVLVNALVVGAARLVARRQNEARPA